MDPRAWEPAIRRAALIGPETGTLALATDPDEGTCVRSPPRLEQPGGIMAVTVPASGPALRTVTCPDMLTPDRDLMIDSVPGRPDLSLFRADRPAPTLPDAGQA